MLLCVRTTLDIHEDVLLEYKKRAAQTRRPLREVIEDALRSELLRTTPTGTDVRNREVITFSGNGLQAGISLDHGADLRDIMDGRS